MTLEEMIGLCKVRYRDPLSILVSDDDWTHHLNQGYMDFLAECDYPLEETTSTVTVTSGQSVANLPAGVHSVLSVTDIDNDTVLTQIDGHSSRAVASLNPTSLGTPTSYYISGSRLTVHPPADTSTVYTIRHYISPPELELDQDEPIIPSRWHRSGIVNKALHLACVDDENYDQADHYMREWMRVVERARYELRKRHGRYPVVPVYQGGSYSKRRGRV